MAELSNRGFDCASFLDRYIYAVESFMAGLERFRKLPPAQRAMVAIAVLLDGRESQTFLEQDAHLGEELGEVAQIMAVLPASTRIPLLGTELRQALGELQEPVRFEGD